VGEVDVVIGGEKSCQSNNTANDGFQQGFAVKPQAPPGRRSIQIPKSVIHPKQPPRAKWAPATALTAMGKGPASRWWRRSAPCSISGYWPEPPHARLITPVADRPGQDRRHAIDPTRISSELGWPPWHSFEQGGYGGGRLGVR